MSNIQGKKKFIIKKPIKNDAIEQNIVIENDDEINDISEEEEDDDDDEEEVAEEDDDDEEKEEDEEEDEEEEDDDDEEKEEDGEDEKEEGDDEPNQKTKKSSQNKSKRSTALVTGVEMLKTSTTAPHSSNIDIDDDDEDDSADIDNEHYLQKFNNEIRDNFIINHHPEAKTHNYEEVKALSRVVRDNRGIIIDPMHRTIPIMSKYEMTRIIGQRAKQLDSGAKSFVKVPLNVIDGYTIAMIELEQKKIPFIIKRPIPNGGVEYWNINDLELLI